MSSGKIVRTAAVAALARRLFHNQAIAMLSAALWAVNPFLIWHAQDVRNYALWAALSPLAMWLGVSREHFIKVKKTIEGANDEGAVV